jgi:large subunit ribosomal protein L30
MEKRKIKIKLVRSGIGRPQQHKDILRGLGLRRINHIVIREDTPEVRGMVKKVPHLVEIVE